MGSAWLATLSSQVYCWAIGSVGPASTLAFRT